MQTLNEFSTSNDEGLKLARRARIKGQYKERDGTVWDPEKDGDITQEKQIMKNLASMRQMISLQNFSDEEDESGDEEEEDEDGEEDEWEDDDDDENDEDNSEEE